MRTPDLHPTNEDLFVGTPDLHPTNEDLLRGDPGPPPHERRPASWGPRTSTPRTKTCFVGTPDLGHPLQYSATSVGLLFGPDGQHIAAAVTEMEAATSWKFEGWDDDFATCRKNVGLSGFEIG